MADKKTQARDRSNSKLDIHIPRYHRRVIENECSMARDQFACERNFLSWFKFSMALASSGAVVFNEFSKKQKQNINSAGNPGGAHDKNIELANASTVFFLVLAMIVLVFSASKPINMATVKLRKGLRTIDITRSIDMAFYPVPYQLQPSKSARVVDKPYTTTHNLGWATVEVAIQNAFIASGSSPAKVSVVIKPAEDSGCIYYFVRLTGEFTEFLEYTRTDGTIIYADQPKSICNISNVHPKWHEPQPLISGANIDMEFEYRLPMLVTETSAPLCQNWATESTPANMPNFEKDPYVYYDGGAR
ncbi:hypothetical protein GGI07_004823 [Coemansia sp. Benny D115]|nr:hypothetical protein GGI07_004823 [Coemansia sp. Benny D115]